MEDTLCFLFKQSTYHPKLLLSDEHKTAVIPYTFPLWKHHNKTAASSSDSAPYFIAW